MVVDDGGFDHPMFFISAISRYGLVLPSKGHISNLFLNHRHGAMEVKARSRTLGATAESRLRRERRGRRAVLTVRPTTWVSDAVRVLKSSDDKLARERRDTARRKGHWPMGTYAATPRQVYLWRSHRGTKMIAVNI